MSYPTVAPYSGQTSAYMAAKKTPPSDDAEFPLAFEPAVQETRQASSVVPPRSDSEPSTQVVSKTFIVIAVLLIALAAGLIAWSLGWFNRPAVSENLPLKQAMPSLRL